MDFTGALLSTLGTVFMFSLLALGVMKIFQIASDLRDLKDVLQDIRRNTQDLRTPPVTSAAGGPLSPQELVRAVHAQSYEESTADLK